jgi:hypothetical protein
MKALVDFPPGSLDGKTAEVISGGEKVSDAVLEDRRYVDNGRVHEQVFIRLRNYKPEFARQLPRPFSGEERMLRSIPVGLRLADGRLIEGAEIGHPWTDQLGVAVDSIPFQLLHPDL